MGKLIQGIDTAEDFDKYYLPVTMREIEEFDGAIKKWEEDWGKKHAA
jgi:hypothetical protein